MSLGPATNVAVGGQCQCHCLIVTTIPPIITDYLLFSPKFVSLFELFELLVCKIHMFVVCEETHFYEPETIKAKRNMFQKHDLPDSFWSFVSVFDRTAKFLKI